MMKHTFPTLETDRLRLRMMTQADDDALFQHLSDANVTRYTDLEAFTHVEQARALIQFHTDLATQNAGARWALIRKEDGEFIGTCGFYLWDKERHRTEIGYDLKPACWGQGYMREALAVLIDYLFNQLDMNRIEALTDPGNARSQHVLLGLGFRREGVLREHDISHGTFLDDVVFGLLRRDWYGADVNMQSGSLIQHRPLEALQVVGMRYRGCTRAPRDERCLDAYAAASVYDAASVPVTVVEPGLPEVQQTDVETDNLGLLGGVVADAVATARRQGKAILMTGGDCTHMTGVLGGLQDVHGPRSRIGLVWFDAHGDFNTPYTTLSGMLGGMPVAVCAGLAYPRWREYSHIAAPLPTDRILMVDVRNLDPAETELIRATEITIVAPASGISGIDLEQAVTNLARRCDLLYLHIDSDILDESYVPNHGTKEPNGPSMEQVLAAMDVVIATGKVAVLAVVSVYGEGNGSERSLAAGIELIRSGLVSWKAHGMA